MGALQGKNPGWVNKMDDRFGQWLRDSIPEVMEDRVRSEVQLAILKERIRDQEIQRRKRRARYGMIAIPVVLVAVISASFVDLGGDGFELEGIGSIGDQGDVYKSTFRGTGFSVQDLKSEEEIQEFNQQLAAGEGVDIGLEGWKINGITKWTLIKEYNVFGKMVFAGSSPHSPPSEFPPDFLNFYQKIQII